VRTIPERRRGNVLAVDRAYANARPELIGRAVSVSTAAQRSAVDPPERHRASVSTAVPNRIDKPMRGWSRCRPRPLLPG
jgi:hypothetical protein